MEAIFRCLVIGCALLTIIFWSMPYFDYMLFSDEQLYLLDQNGLGGTAPGNTITYWGTLAIWLALSAGLFFYKKIARITFVLFYAGYLVVGLFSGIQVITPYESIISGLIGLADGAILTMAYLTSIGAKFE